MAERPAIRTRKVTRDKLAQFLTNLELIKAFENMALDVSETLPDAIAGATEDAGSLIANDMFGRREPATPPTMLSPSDAERVMTQASFAPRQPIMPARDDQAGQILATQIFGG